MSGCHEILDACCELFKGAGTAIEGVERVAPDKPSRCFCLCGERTVAEFFLGAHRKSILY